MVGRIGIVLSFEAEGGAKFVDLSALARHGTEVVPSIELHAGFSRQHLEDAAGTRIDRACCKRELSMTAPVDDKIVIVPQPALKLIVRSVDARANRLLLSEIKRGAGNAAQLAG